MKAVPRVSVLLFCRNGAATIRRSVESVLGQTYRDFEYVIQDGVSIDGTMVILREYDDPRIDLRSEPDAGAADAFWSALRRCRGEYVAACLSDEELSPTALAEGVAALDADLATVAIIRDAELTTLDGRGTSVASGRPFDLQAYLANRFAPNFAASMFRRAALEAIGLHTRDWDLDAGEFELWCRLALHGPIRYVPGVAARYAVHPDQLSAEPANIVRLARGRVRTIERLAAEGVPGVNDEGVRRSRAATIASFSRQLQAIGASQEAAGLALDGSDLVPLPPSAAPDIDEYVRVAREERQAGRERAALHVLQAAVRFSNADAPLLREIARTHAAAGLVDQALATYDAALRMRPEFADAHWERGELLERRGHIDEALDAWHHADLPHNAARHSLALVASLKSPSSSNRSLLASHLDWARHHVSRPFYLKEFTPPDWQPDGRVVIAYACSFWDAATITYQLLPILRRHDRSRFTVLAYAPYEPGPLVTAAVDRVHVVGDLSDEAFVRRVRGDGVHILVETTGHSIGHRFAAMGSRCAPVQVSYLNYTSTCGVPEVDYIIGDDISVPRDTDVFFTERVYRLPGCFFCFTYEDAALPPVAPPPSVATATITFGCFGSGGKINPVLLDLWAEILRRTPRSRLFIRNNELTPQDNREALALAFEQRGIGRTRLLLLPGTTREGVLAAYADVDISLDTFPYCGGNTIAESLWQGVPVVTLKGDRFSAAYGASLLTASGLADLVADTPEAYIDTAVTLAADQSRLAKYRANLREMVERFGFSDADRFTAGLERSYLDMLRQKYAPAPAPDWRAPLTQLAAAAGSPEARLEWARRYGRPEYAALNRLLCDLGGTGLGLDNAAGGTETTGEGWLLPRLARLFDGQNAPVIVDAGAHEGALALELLRLLPHARVHAFEPMPQVFAALAANLAGTTAEASCLALGSSIGTLRLHDHGFEGGSMHASPYVNLFSRFYGTTATTRTVDVPLMTLDAYCDARGIASVALLKIDTEGHELEVLRGAARLLRAGAIRAVLFEFNYTHIFSRTFFSDFFELLPDFAFFRLLPHGLLPLASSDWAGTEVFRYQNVLAVPAANADDIARLTGDTDD